LQFAQMGWKQAEGILKWEHNSFIWAYGEARNTSRSTQWRSDGRTTPGESNVEIIFDWPVHYETIGSKTITTREHGQLPNCNIRYNNPTPEMQALLCRLNTKFFEHRELPPIPELEQVYLAPPPEDYSHSQIPLHMRGELVMPDCEQLQAAYYQQYQDVFERYPDPKRDPDAWMYHIIGSQPVCVRCPGCQAVYSVYKDGGDDPNCYCETCQFSLIEGYHDAGSHVMAFARQYANYTLDTTYYGYPLYIPDDCSPEIKQKMIDRYADRIID